MTSPLTSLSIPLSIPEHPSILPHSSSSPSTTQTRIAATYARVSTQDQEQESTSLDTQEAACIKLAHQHQYTVLPQYSVREVYSGLTTDRPKLKQVLQWVDQNLINALIIYSTDRFSRSGLDLLLLIRACHTSNVDLLCVTEDMGTGAIGELINYTRGWASQMEAAKIKERCIRGKIARAKNNEIPGGFGSGYFGLIYDRSTKLFHHHPEQIIIAKEILHRCIKGESINRITIDLQSRGIKGIHGRTIGRSSVRQVLWNARVYAGTITWKDFTLMDKVIPIISHNDALLVAQRLKQNGHRNLGLGQRKWLSGRVFCGICGKRYALESTKKCHCRGDVPTKPEKCPAPRINFIRLSTLAYEAMITALTHPETIIKSYRQHHDQWQQQLKTLQHQQQRIDERRQLRESRRRLLSFQHEQGGLSNDEYLKRLNTIKKEEEHDALIDLEGFLQSEPPNPEVIRESCNRILSINQVEGNGSLKYRLPQVIKNPSDKIATDLANMVDLKVVINPSSIEGQEFTINVMMNLPVMSERMVSKGLNTDN